MNEVSNLQIVESWCPVGNDWPDLIIEVVMIHFQIVNRRFFFK